MRRILSLVLCAWMCWVSLPARAADDAVVADKNYILPGQTVTLRWYITGKKVTVSGGRFGKGALVTGRTSLTDQPKKTTRYQFDVWYMGLMTPKLGAPPENRLLHAQYNVLVEVGAPINLTAYRDPHGWQIRHPSGWKHDSVTTPDEGSDGQVFFQLEDDSVERIAVAIMPVKQTSCTDLMEKIRADIPSHYQNVDIGTDTELTHQGVPALLTTFSGTDQSHPGTRTRSVVLAFIKGERAYVISARTYAYRFPALQSVLETMTKSFTFTK